MWSDVGGGRTIVAPEGLTQRAFSSSRPAIEELRDLSGVVQAVVIFPGNHGWSTRPVMTSSGPARILVVTDRVEATPELLDSIRGRATRGQCEFHVLVPNPAPAEWHPTHPERHDKVAAAGRVLSDALPLIEEAAGTPVDGVVSIRHDPMDAIEETLHDADFDEIILFTAPHRIERWLHLDLPHRVAHLGLPVTTVSSEHRPGDPGA